MLPAEAGFKFPASAGSTFHYDKTGENFNHRNTFSILRIALKLHCVPKFEPNVPPRAGDKRGRFAKVSFRRVRV